MANRPAFFYPIEKGITVAVNEYVAYDQDVAATLALFPDCLARARPEMGVTG
jgi:hypothetical protein